MYQQQQRGSQSTPSNVGTIYQVPGDVARPEAVTTSAPVRAQTQKHGRFAQHAGFPITKICGDLLITFGVFMLVGQSLEMIGLSVAYSAYGIQSSIYSYIDYVGFWGGVIVIACGSVATVSGARRTDVMVIADFAAALVGLALSIVVLAIPASKIYVWTPFNMTTAASLILAGYGLLIALGSLAAIASIVLMLFCTLAILKGCGALS